VNKDMLAPLTGVAFIILLFVGFAIQGEPPEATDDVQDIVDHYIDNKDSVQLGAFLVVPSGALLMFFAAYLRKIFSAAEGAGGMLSVLPLVGLAIIAIGAAIDSTISFALAESADDIDPIAVQGLQALWDNDFMPFALGMEIFLVSVGLLVVRTGVFPKWLGWVALVLAVVALIPADVGFIAFVGGALLLVVFSVILTLRARSSSPQPA